MKCKPILFSGEMVRAILEGRKTQTRRVVKPQFPDKPTGENGKKWGLFDDGFYYYGIRCPFGKPGGQLWLRETFVLERWDDEPKFVADRPTQYNPGDGSEWSEEYWLRPHYRATDPAPDLCYEDDENDDGEPKCKWRPSIFMPRWASRITLEIVHVLVDRVQNISRDDAKAEGVSHVWSWDGKINTKHPEHFRRALLNPYIANYSVLWDEINAKRGCGWGVNPWVWVVEFKVVKNEIQ